MATPRRSAMILCGLLFLAAVTTATAQDAPNDRVSRHYVLDQSSVKRTIGDNAPQKAFLDLFAAAGVADISRTNLFYNTRTGDLYLIANRRQLPPLEEVLAPLSKAPPTVAIETVFVEFSSGVKIPLIGVPATNSATFILTERQSRKTLEALKEETGADVLTVPVAKTVSGRQARMEVETERNLSPQTPPPRPRNILMQPALPDMTLILRDAPKS